MNRVLSVQSAEAETVGWQPSGIGETGSGVSFVCRPCVWKRFDVTAIYLLFCLLFSIRVWLLYKMFTVRNKLFLSKETMSRFLLYEIYHLFYSSWCRVGEAALHLSIWFRSVTRFPIGVIVLKYVSTNC